MRLGDLDELKKAIETYDKFACLPDTKLVPFRMLNEPEKDYEPYVQLRDIRNAVDNAPTVIENGLIAEDYIKEKMFFVKRECDDQAIPVIAVNDLIAFERPQGKWISSYRECKCSICNFKTVVDTYRYCPNCGAKMERLKGGRE